MELVEKRKARFKGVVDVAAFLSHFEKLATMLINSGGSRGFQRFQLKPPFRTLTYSSYPRYCTQLASASKYQVLGTADSANIQPLGPGWTCAIKYCHC